MTAEDTFISKLSYVECCRTKNLRQVFTSQPKELARFENKSVEPETGCGSSMQTGRSMKALGWKTKNVLAISE